MTERRCRKCGCVFEELEVEAFFRANRGGRQRSMPTNSQARSVCIGCELSARTDRKRENRPREKARRTLQHHADKYVRLGMARSREDFAQRYGWDLDQMAHDIEHSMKNGCPYCWQLFAQMENGLRDCTLDVIDAHSAPYYRSNVRWCCSTCNTEKARTKPALWGAKLQAWEKWRRFQQQVKDDPQECGFLF